LNSSWTNSYVDIKTISKGKAPVLNSQVLWKSPDGMACYAWGGSLSQVQVGGQPPDLELWQFASDGIGGGNWSLIPVSDSVFSNLLRPSFESGTTIGDTGYLFGGFVDKLADPSITNSLYLPGIVSFNMTSGS